ncbi:hypothetical protein B0H94_11525 [Salsuginibacillus halophilus]|uniref:Uncharacterized protein n=1 Tax=Salsuginibacillus halophilus TaxID=517424 RepID=A0A2P8H898_9BACI|nr:SE1832 family protein [Salsuginibacillus halophilus]PSL42421.1 hypothetical protein B0H94_11525 [Salsuginibacillus halophilus]
MTKAEIEAKMTNLKADYARIQGDLDKLESVGGNVAGPVRELEIIEDELSSLRLQLQEA